MNILNLIMGEDLKDRFDLVWQLDGSTLPGNAIA